MNSAHDILLATVDGCVSLSTWFALNLNDEQRLLFSWTATFRILELTVTQFYFSVSWFSFA